MEDELIEKIENEDERGLVSAYVMSNGEIVDADIVQKAQQQNGKTNTVDLDIDDFGESYASGRVYRPPLRLKNLKMFSSENAYHQRCINVVSQDCCSGWEIITVDKNGKEVRPENNNKRDKKDNILYDFFNDCNPMEDFIELCKQFIVDYRTFGFSTMELTRNRIGQPRGLYHTQSETFRIARDLSNYLDTDEKYMVQVVNVHERIFKVFNKDPYKKAIEPHTNNPMSEILYLRSYHVDGRKYGIPEWLPSLKAMVGNEKVAEYNITFFENEAVPRFAVIVQGGKLDDGTKTKITNYFKKDLKGVKNSNKTLVLSSPKGAEIKLVPLANENKDGSFRFYKKDNRDEIITAHGVPHHRVQIMDAGNSGTISPATMFQLDKNYKYSVVVPIQQKLQILFNTVIKYGFGITNKKIKFAELDIGEDEQRANTMKTIAAAHEKYYSIGAMDINQIKEDLKLPQYAKDNTDEDIYEWATTPRPVYLLRQAQLQAEQMAQQQGLDMNTSTGNVNESTNDFNDKSKEQTQGNTQFNDDQMNQLMMKRQAIMEVLKMLDVELAKSIELENSRPEVKNK